MSEIDWERAKLMRVSDKPPKQNGNPPGMRKKWAMPEDFKEKYTELGFTKAREY